MQRALPDSEIVAGGAARARESSGLSTFRFPLSAIFGGERKYISNVKTIADLLARDLAGLRMGPASAANFWYINGANGSDSNDGKSSTSAWKTFDHGSNNKSGNSMLVQAGDTVYVAPGSYLTTTGYTLADSGASGNPITYIAQALPTSAGGVPGMVILSGLNSSGHRTAATVVTMNGSYIVFDGFDVSNGTGAGLAGGAGANYNWIQNCCFHDNSTNSQQLTCQGINWVIKRNVFYNWGAAPPLVSTTMAPSASTTALITTRMSITTRSTGWGRPLPAWQQVTQARVRSFSRTTSAPTSRPTTTFSIHITARSRASTICIQKHRLHFLYSFLWWQLHHEHGRNIQFDCGSGIFQSNRHCAQRLRSQLRHNLLRGRGRRPRLCLSGGHQRQCERRRLQQLSGFQHYRQTLTTSPTWEPTSTIQAQTAP